METETWALVTDWIGNEFADAVTRLVQEDCRSQGRNLIVLTLGSLSYHLEQAQLEAHLRPVLRSTRISRILWNSGQTVRGGGSGKLESIVSRLPSRPMLTLGARIPGIPHLAVHHQGAQRQLLNHLWDEHGYRRFAWVGGPLDNPVALRRREVLLTFLADRGVELRSVLDQPGDFNLSAGRQAGEALRRWSDEIDVVVAANDSMAIGVLEALGPRIPVVGFDNHPSAAAFGLTTIDPHLEREVLHSLRCLEAFTAETRALDPLPLALGQVVLRGSCGCPGVAVDPRPSGAPTSSSTERVGPLFEAIFESQDMAELTDRLNRALPSVDIDYWRMLAPQERREWHPDELNFWPEAPAESLVHLVIHSLFREQELYGYFVHDLTAQDYTLSEWLRINLSLTLHAWHRQSGNLQVQRLLQVEIDRFSRRQRDVEAVINSLPVWIVELDRRFNLRYANRAWKSLLGRHQGERMQGAFLPTVLASDRDRVETRLAQVLRTKDSQTVDFTFLSNRQVGSTVLCEIQGLGDEEASPLATLFGALHGGGGLRLVGLNLNPLVEGLLRPEELLFKHYEFSPRETELLGWVTQGLDSEEIADEMGIGPSTVRVMLHQIYKKTGVTKRRELMDLMADYSARAPYPQSLTQVLLSRLLRRQ